MTDGGVSPNPCLIGEVPPTPCTVDEDVFLNDIWSVYFHNPISNNWERDGYVKINDVSTIEDFWQTYREIKNHIHVGMFFFMREHIFPKWDDPDNKYGSFLSFKVLKDDIEDFSEKILMHLLGESLLVESYAEKWNHINGISFSPKKNFSIVKIWLKSKELKSKEIFKIPKSYQGDIMFKDNNM
jgi:hypothetical protein